MAKVSITLPNRASIILETEDAVMVREALGLLLQPTAAANETPATPTPVAPPTPEPETATSAAVAALEPPAEPLPAAPPQPEPSAIGNPADANAAVAAPPGRRYRRRIAAYRRMRARQRRIAAVPGDGMTPLNGITDAAIPPPQPATTAAPPYPPPDERPDPAAANGLPPPVAPPFAAPVDTATETAAVMPVSPPPPVMPELGISGTTIALEAGLPTPYDIPRQPAAGLTALGQTAVKLAQPAAPPTATPSAVAGAEAPPACALTVSEIPTAEPTEIAPPPTCAAPVSPIPPIPPAAVAAETPPPAAPPTDAIPPYEDRPDEAPPGDAMPPDEGAVEAAQSDTPPGVVLADALPLSYAPLMDDDLPPGDDLDLPDDAPPDDALLPDEAPPIDALPEDDDPDDDEPYYAWNSAPANALTAPPSRIAAGNYAWAAGVGASAVPPLARRNPAYAPAPSPADAAAGDGAAAGGLRLAEQTPQAREAFTAFCRSVNPLGDMRRVVVAAEGAARCFATDGVDAEELGALFDLAGWRRPPNFTQTLRNAARSKFGWLERIPGRTGRYAPTNLGRSETIPVGQRR